MPALPGLGAASPARRGRRRALARQSVSPDIALPFPFPEMARAVVAWVAWKDERYSQVEELAGEVLETRRVDEPPFPFAWICLWPLIAVRLAEGRTAGAFSSSAVNFCSRPKCSSSRRLWSR